MQLNSAFGSAKMRPGKDRQAQVDDRGVKCVNCFLKLKAKVIAGIELPGLMDEDLRKVAVNAPVSSLIGIGQGGARDFTAYSHVVKLLVHGSQATFNVAQAFAISQLGKGHTQELIVTCKRANTVIAVISVNTMTKFGHWEEVHDLREYGFSLVH